MGQIKKRVIAMKKTTELNENPAIVLHADIDLRLVIGVLNAERGAFGDEGTGKGVLVDHG